jgi:tetratricopeptide (TPR) repeat protein
MRRYVQPSTIAPILIIGVVVATLGYANWRGSRPEREETAAVAAFAPTPRTSRDDLQQRVTDMERRLRDHPADLHASLLLADALQRLMRVTGNVGLAVRAEQVLKDALEENPGSYDANRMLGALYLSQHRFSQAIAVATNSREARPYDPVNYGVLGDAHLELGDYDEAFDAFDRMMALRPSAAAYARVAYARELQGDLKGALESMKLSADATSAEDLEGLAWTRSQIGDIYFQLGQLNGAKDAYASASQAFPGHPFAVIGYAKVIAAEGDITGALGLLQQLAASSATPELAARIGELLDRLGRHEEAERQYALAEAGWRSDVPDPKNLARFLADHDRKTDEAVMMAERARSERHDIFTEDVLAWAYFKAGRLADARAAIARALRTNTSDRDIRAHEAAIAKAGARIASR